MRRVRKNIAQRLREVAWTLLVKVTFHDLRCNTVCVHSVRLDIVYPDLVFGSI